MELIILVGIAVALIVILITLMIFKKKSEGEQKTRKQRQSIISLHSLTYYFPLQLNENNAESQHQLKRGFHAELKLHETNVIVRVLSSKNR